MSIALVWTILAAGASAVSEIGLVEQCNNQKKCCWQTLSCREVDGLLLPRLMLNGSYGTMLDTGSWDQTCKSWRFCARLTRIEDGWHDTAGWWSKSVLVNESTRITGP